MTSLILMDEFAEEAMDAGRKLLASTDDILELPKTKGCYVAKKGAKMPEGATTLREFEYEGKTVILFTVT